jgi:GGDEF domain-containing protein
MKPRSLIALAVGLVGLVLGVVAAVAGSGVVAVLAGVAALAAGGAGLLPDGAPPKAPEGSAAANIADLENALASQIQARVAAEEAVQSLGSQLAKAQNPTAGTPAAAESVVNSTAALTDPETGLFGEDYFNVSINARIAAARRHLRPVAIAVVEVVRLHEGGSEPANAMIVSEAITKTLREADTSCRMSDGRFGLVLEDTPENGAIWTVERIRREIGLNDDTLTMWAGVACYPSHAFDSANLLAQAVVALDGARDWHQDRIEVANPS